MNHAAPITANREAELQRPIGVAFHRIVRGHNHVTLYLGDCLEVAIEADAIISDPPYGMKWDGKVTAGRNGHSPGMKSSNFGETIMHDDEPFDPAPWLGYEKVVLFGCNHYAQRLPVGTTLVWLKRFDAGFGSFLSDAELAWMKGGHGVYVRRDTSLMGETMDRLHPTQKPVAIMAWCLEMAKVPEGATVCDPYMGSGTTGIACLRTNRNFVGIEKDPEHFKTACARFEREANQGALL